MLVVIKPLNFIGILRILVKNVKNAGHFIGIPLWLMCFSLGRSLGVDLSCDIVSRYLLGKQNNSQYFTEHRSPRSMRCGTEIKVAPRLYTNLLCFDSLRTSEKAKPPIECEKT